jgi:hypothetical protein
MLAKHLTKEVTQAEEFIYTGDLVHALIGPVGRSTQQQQLWGAGYGSTSCWSGGCSSAGDRCTKGGFVYGVFSKQLPGFGPDYWHSGNIRSCILPRARR